MKRNYNYKKSLNISCFEDELSRLIPDGYKYTINYEDPIYFIKINDELIISIDIFMTNGVIGHNFYLNTKKVIANRITSDEIKIINSILVLLNRNKKQIISKFNESYESKKANYILNTISFAFEKALDRLYEYKINNIEGGEDYYE